MSWTRGCSIVALAAMLVMCADTLSAAGSVITIGFAGTINFVDGGLPIADAIAVGSPFFGTYSYESGATDNSPNPTVGSYSFPGHSMVVTVGGLELSCSGLVLGVYTNSYSDLYTVQTITPFIAYGTVWSSMNVYMVDDTGTPLADDSLPLEAPNLDDFALGATFDLIEQDHWGSSIAGDITWIARVPEPATLGLFGTGAVFGLRRRRRC